MGELMSEAWCGFEEDEDEAPAPAMPRRRQQQRRRALAAELRGEFDRRLLSGEDIQTLSRAFGIEPWYAQRRAKRVLERSRDREISPFLNIAAEAEEELTPLQYACRLLGVRVRPLRSGYYVLDGRPAGPKEVARAANRLLRERGQSEIPYPGLTPLYN